MRVWLALAALLAGLPGVSADQASTAVQSGTAYANVSDGSVMIGNEHVERRWLPDRLVTVEMLDRRGDPALNGTLTADLALVVDGVHLTSARIHTSRARAETVDDEAVRVVFDLLLPGVASITRTVEVRSGIAGFSVDTRVDSLVPLTLSGYELDRLPAGSNGAATVHAFRAGADWRYDEGWEPQLAVGDHRPGHWRVSESAEPGDPLEAPGQWISMAYDNGRTLFSTMTRNNYASSRAHYDGSVATTAVDLSRDVVYFGPLEEDVHVSNPTPAPARHRVILPGRPVDLETVFTGFGLDADDEAWQHHRFLRSITGWTPYVTFNTDKVDRGERSTGAKDDADYERFLSLADAAEQMGVETFVFDDGWQARSGDWCPDSHECPEPRWDGSEDSKFRPRFPDPHFAAVRDVLSDKDMDLGLWFTPMEFHPSAEAFQRNPQWACAPTGHATAAVNVAQPNSGSNEAGIGVWNPEAWGLHPDTGEPARLVDYIEDRVRRAVDDWDVVQFKFDYMVWLDCAGVEPIDLYTYQESFRALLDRLRADRPDVGFGVDETNDYRMFPYSLSYGPSWFQNGTPQASQLLHNVWNLAPWVPGYALGQHALGNSSDRANLGIETLMAVALPSHITFWLEIDTALTDAERDRVKLWTDFYKAHRSELATFTYPLGDDPLEGTWTALQPWNPDTGRGFLLVYRQDGAEDTHSFGLRGVTDGTYRLTLHDPATGAATELDPRTGAELRDGLDVTVAQPNGYAIVQVERV